MLPISLWKYDFRVVRMTVSVLSIQGVVSQPLLWWFIWFFSPQSGFLSTLPFITAWVIGILGGYLADFLLTKSFRLVTVRKVATVLGKNRTKSSDNSWGLQQPKMYLVQFVCSSFLRKYPLFNTPCGSALCCLQLHHSSVPSDTLLWTKPVVTARDVHQCLRHCPKVRQ